MKIYPLDNREFSLSNEGDLELFFVGVGSAFTKRQYQTNLLIVKGNDHLLIDCGSRCPQAFDELGVQIPEVKNFLITHSHADHIGGLEEVALMGRYFNKRKPNMVINETYQQILWDMSLRGGASFNEIDVGTTLSFEDYFDVIRPQSLDGFPRETLGAKVGKIDIKMMRTKHTPDTSIDWRNSFWSCGAVIDDRILFTSDTLYDVDLIDDYEKKFNFEAIFHDCQFFTGGVHASLEELSQLPADYKKKTFLTHYGDNWEDFVDTVEQYGFAGLAKQHVYYNFDK
jgi:ribonuclease BN (tRNA processing enzyme)